MWVIFIVKNLKKFLGTNSTLKPFFILILVPILLLILIQIVITKCLCLTRKESKKEQVFPFNTSSQTQC